MARLIPSFIDERAPPGERDVFAMLASGPDGWTALHSLDLTPWNRGLRTEIDFVVLVPDSGVLCLEIKSHEFISFEDDQWIPRTIKRSPFKQAADGRHALFRHLREIAPHFHKIPVVHCCIFTHSYFDLSPNLSVPPREFMDARAFRTFVDGESFCADLRRRMRSCIDAEDTLKPLMRPLDRDQIESIINLCLPVQRNRPHAREQIERREHDIERILRIQQKPILQLSMSNARVLIEGAAGTGKTLIAVEIARRAAERGRRTGLIFFNQLVADSIRESIQKDVLAPPNLVVGRAIRVMAEMTGLAIPGAPSTQYWDQVLPEQLEERLTDPELRIAAQFDFLVVDEAQDLIARPNLWGCLMQFLNGGMSSGSYCLLGDFENQVLGERAVMNTVLASILDAGRPATYQLSENCRNYKIVGESAIRLSGFGKSVYSGYMRTGGGLQNYDIFFYADGREQESQVAQWIKEFRSQGYRPEEITILSFCSPEHSAAANLAAKGLKLRPAWQHAKNSVLYTSVQAFKGLENKVIILTDIVLGEPHFHRHLFYTGMTRASESVRVCCDQRSQQTLATWLTQ
ncbi:MAG: NERD domain-containing protein [Gammaproteobacteria bacterium]|nr:NERD domain-containing protein [Gammaproteobacteria bacterium]